MINLDIKRFLLFLTLTLPLLGLSAPVTAQQLAPPCPPQIVEDFNYVSTSLHPTPFPPGVPANVAREVTDLPRDCARETPLFRTPAVGSTNDAFYENRESYRIQQRERDDESQLLTYFNNLATGPFGTGQSRFIAGSLGFQPIEGGPTSFAEAAACTAQLLGCENFTNPCNLLRNGSFDVDTAGWDTNTTLEIIPDAVSGDGALTIGNGWASTIVDMKANNRRFVLSGYAKSSDGAGWAGIGVDFLNADGEELSEIFYNIPRTQNYKPFNLVKPSPPKTRFARVWIYAADSRQIQLDELDVHPVGCEDGIVEQNLAISSAGDQSHAVGNIVTVFTYTINPNGAALQWSANNLPPGLNIESTTGWITGQASQEGLYLVTISVTDGISQSDIGFKWNIVPRGTDPEICNALPNGTFETGTDGWFTNTELQITEDASQGRQALVLNGGSMSITVPAVAGTDYQLTARYKSEPGSIWSGYGIDYLDAERVEIAEEVKPLPATSAYTDTSISGTVPANAEYIQLWIYSPSTRDLTLDDLILRDASCNV